MLSENKKISLSKSEEDYLKVIYILMIDNQDKKISNNSLSERLKISPPSVNNMVKKLKEKKFVDSVRYGKLSLTTKGEGIALNLIRKHRLWETFLCNCLNFSWDEVHDVAEQLEHIKSSKLIDQLDDFMDNPKKDPHGNVIPQKGEKFVPQKKVVLASLSKNTKCKVVSVNDSSVAFLRYLTEINLGLGSELTVLDIMDFDGSIQIKFNNIQLYVSNKFAEHVFVEIILP